MTLDDLAELISDNWDDAVEFGDAKIDKDIVPSKARIEETERLLGAKLPPSYLWFVNNYGGGEVYGEEIYSVYDNYSNESVGDIAYATLIDRDNVSILDTDIVFCRSLFGQYFIGDTREVDDNGEYPIYIQLGNMIEEREKYADSFAEFLSRRILETVA